MAISEDSTAVLERIEAVKRELQSLTVVTKEDVRARNSLLTVSQQTTADLESGFNSTWRLLMQPMLAASVKTALDMGLVKIFTTTEGPLRATDLAKTTGADKLLIVRILRPLAASGFLIETGFETWEASPKAQAFNISTLVGGISYMLGDAALSCNKLPDFLAQSGYKNPESTEGPWQYAHNTQLHMFEWLKERPKKLHNFNVFMGGQRQDRVPFFDAYPMDQILFKDFHESSENVLLVDVGGGHGYNLEAFKKCFPDVSGKLILQDLPVVIDEIKDLDESIIRWKHNFFDPQPVIGAKTYYFRGILHDWPDDKFCDILRNIVKAMRPGYSKLLINEWVLPDVGVPLYPALLDIVMMAAVSGIERTERQWTDLLSSVGLKIVKIWSHGPEDDALIEAVLEE